LWRFHDERPDATLISFVDDGTIIVQSKTWDENLLKLKKAYNVVFELTNALGLVLEHDKSEAFHFSRKHGDLNPPVDLGYAPYTGKTPLVPSKIWRYLGFFFDRKLLFKEHAMRYARKAFSATGAMLSLGNSVRGLKPKHKRLLYRSCILPIALYGIRLWHFRGAKYKGTMKELNSMQRKAAIWILGAFKTSPGGAAESLAGLIPIHLQIRKLIHRNYARMHTLADSHVTRLIASSSADDDDVAWIPSRLSNKCKSPLMDMRAFEKNVSVDAIPFHPFSHPGKRLLDVYPDRIFYDVVLITGKNAKERAKARETRINNLKTVFERVSSSMSCVALVADASVPTQRSGHQAIAAWGVWYLDEYRTNWRAGGLATSDDAETNAIGGAFSDLFDNTSSLSDIDEIHIFTDSTNAIKHSLNPSIHSAQKYSLEILSCLNSWIGEHDDRQVFFHHVPDSEDFVFEPHRTVHNLSVSTKVECGGNPLRSLAFDRKQITDDVMEDWSNLFRLSQYVGRYFMYPRWSVARRTHSSAKRMRPSHLKGGTWLKDTGHSSTLTAQMARGLTSHAPIGAYRHRFNIGDKNEACPHCEEGPPETFHHVLYRCLKHPTRPPDAPRFSEDTPYWDFFGEFIMENPGAYAFTDRPEYSLTVADGTRRAGRWAKDAPTSGQSRRAKSRGGNTSLPGRALPGRTIPIGHTLFRKGVYGKISHRSFALTGPHANAVVFHKAINPARGVMQRKRDFGIMFSRT
jgi:hypothetical protein